MNIADGINLSEKVKTYGWRKHYYTLFQKKKLKKKKQTFVLNFATLIIPGIERALFRGVSMGKVRKLDK